MKHAKPAAVDSEGAAALCARIAAALLGNYGLTVGLGSLVAALLAQAGMLRVEAVTLATMLAFLVFLVILIVAFHTPRVARLWAWMVGVGGASYGLALAITRAAL